ncbi:YbhB/YbcL family Raf kinase inhibitor-like protein [Helicobacter sp. 11S02629-2]|uniref:YbhB/YbcL family Raf kinase inhibitor-like protein n=1 Tax=Helicobacter sp. 11S02629-2 TaxID=1476195 RepID=UPI000BA54BE9|nr:YbhB/YbcL family Raf kinase inhibitor-like protein [Helicobacter sp. 11S02629-2]PAF45980.1 hypothetical protein BKH40_00785 [Helicobacter sp. 11S02629-2]
MHFIKVKLPDLQKDGYLGDKYGGNAEAKYKNENGDAIYSPAIEWDAVPNAKSYCLELIDYDATPVVGFIVPHWGVIDLKTPSLKENASSSDKSLLQAVNVRARGLYRSDIKTQEEKDRLNAAASFYIGPRPPDKDHNYHINVYALDIESLDLKVPFFLGDMMSKMYGHIIAQGSTHFRYKRCMS